VPGTLHDRDGEAGACRVAGSYAEKSGTFTNTEGYVQPIHQAIDPVGESRPDWEIFSTLSGLMGYPLEYGDVKEILKEIRQAIPGHATLGPGPTPPKPDQAALDHYLREDYALDLAERYGFGGEGRPLDWTRGGELVEPGARGEGKNGSFTLIVGQTLFHSGKMSTRAKGLLAVQAAGRLSINPADAARLGVTDGGRLRLSNTQGEIQTSVTLSDRVPSGLAFFPEHFDTEVQQLMSLRTDPLTKVPYYKVAEVTIERL
jgi:formate dehydrogenase alpha subunit